MSKIKEITKDLDASIKKDIKETTKSEKKSFLYKKNIGISVSESQDIEELGFSKIHQQDIILELSRYLLINGGTLIYGGDLRAQGYTFLFSELVEQYVYRRGNTNHFRNYFSFPLYVDMPIKHKLDFKKNGIEIINVPPPNHIKVDLQKFYSPVNNDNLFIWAESLTEMRTKMCKESDARILMGGASTNFKGKYPGLLEEAILSLTNNIPTYLIGAFGGITKSIIECLKGRVSQELTQEWQMSSNAAYSDFVKFYNAKQDTKKIDYSIVLDVLRRWDAKALSENNGLTVEENERLFETIHLPEIIFLVLKGLKNKLD